MSPVQPSGTAGESPAPPPPATTAAASPRLAGATLMMQVGSRDGVPHPKFMGVSPFFLSLWAPRCTQGLGQTPLGQRRGSRTPWGGDGRSPLSCLQHPKTKPGAWHGQVIRLIRSSGCLALPPKASAPSRSSCRRQQHHHQLRGQRGGHGGERDAGPASLLSHRPRVLLPTLRTRPPLLVPSEAARVTSPLWEATKPAWIRSEVGSHVTASPN